MQFNKEKQHQQTLLLKCCSPGPAVRPAYDSEPSLWAPEADRIPEEEEK